MIYVYETEGSFIGLEAASQDNISSPHPLTEYATKAAAVTAHEAVAFSFEPNEEGEVVPVFTTLADITAEQERSDKELVELLEVVRTHPSIIMAASSYPDIVSAVNTVSIVSNLTFTQKVDEAVASLI